jgi:hypothetical protein
MNIEHDGNQIEAIVWLVLALALGVHAFFREKRLRPTLLFLAAMIVVFGVSDLVEAETGAWWRPWWLLVWKGSCLLLMLAAFLRYLRLSKTGTSTPVS